MLVTLDRLDDAFHFRATNETGCSVDLDASNSAGGNNKGVRPMQLVLMSLGGCSGIDVLQILRKQRQLVVGLRVSVDGERPINRVPALYEDIQIHFQFEGDLDPATVKRAVELSLGKYCPVAAMLSQSAKITYRITLNGEVHE